MNAANKLDRSKEALTRIKNHIKEGVITDSESVAYAWLLTILESKEESKQTHSFEEVTEIVQDVFSGKVNQNQDNLTDIEEFWFFLKESRPEYNELGDLYCQMILRHKTSVKD